MMFSRILTAGLTAAAALNLCSSALAAPRPAELETTSVTVRIGDLDLASDAGARAALTRIRAAAGIVCGDPGDLRDLNYRVRREACMTSAVERTLAELDSPPLTALVDYGRRMTLAAYRGD
jgi:UrcA family protein